MTEMKAAYVKSGLHVAKAYPGWQRYSKVAYQSDTHGNRFVQNYADSTAKAYGKYEKSGTMPVGSYLAKDSFVVTKKGQVGVGPLFIMRRLAGTQRPMIGSTRWSCRTVHFSVKPAVKIRRSLNSA